MYYYQNDWLMRQIELTAHFIARAVFGRDTVEYEIIDETSREDILYKLMKELTEKGRIPDAEAALFECINDYGGDRYLELGLRFYLDLNTLSDDELASKQFSREKIMEGIDRLVDIYNLPSFTLND